MTRVRQYGYIGLILVLIVYFLSHAMLGKHSFYNWMNARKEKALLLEEYARVSKQEQDLSVDVKALQDESLDLDFLDERARKLLNLAHPNDYFIEYQILLSDINDS